MNTSCAIAPAPLVRPRHCRRIRSGEMRIYRSQAIPDSGRFPVFVSVTSSAVPDVMSTRHFMSDFRGHHTQFSTRVTYGVRGTPGGPNARVFNPAAELRSKLLYTAMSGDPAPTLFPTTWFPLGRTRETPRSRVPRFADLSDSAGAGHGGRILAGKLHLRIASNTPSAVPSFPAREPQGLALRMDYGNGESASIQS